MTNSRVSDSMDDVVAPMFDAPPSVRRWRIIHSQLRAGFDPCFGTEQRYFCKRDDCPYRHDCLTLRSFHRVIEAPEPTAAGGGPLDGRRSP